MTPLSDSALTILKTRYFLKDKDGNLLEDWEGLCHRVAKHIASNDPGYEGPFYEMMEQRLFLPNSPTLFNAGTGKTMLSACTVVPVRDSMGTSSSRDAITDAWKWAAIIGKSGAGVGFDWSELRQKNAPLSTRGVASGPVSFMKVVCGKNGVADAVIAGGARRIAVMSVLRCDHPDVIEFIECKNAEGDIPHTNLSVAITDNFMKALEEDSEYDLIDPHTKLSVGKIKAKKVWNKICEGSFATGEPGVIFIDTVNKYHNLKALASVAATNPSLRGDTRVLTDRGIYCIRDLQDNRCNVLTYDGTYASATCELSGHDKQLYKITLTGGHEYFCTKEHKWPIIKEKILYGQRDACGKREIHRITESINKKETCELTIGDKIPISKNKCLSFGNMGTRDEGFLLGWNCGDGSITIRKDNGKSQFGFFFSEDDEFARQKVGDILRNLTGEEHGSKPRCRINKKEYEMHVSAKVICDIFNKFGFTNKRNGIPTAMWATATDDFRRGFIDGLFSSDGYVDKDRLMLTTAHYQLAKDISELLGFYGIKNSITKSVLDNASFPNGKNYHKQYTRYDIVIGKHEAIKFRDIFTISNPNKWLALSSIVFDRSGSSVFNYYKIVSVEPTDLYEDVWDLSVDDTTHTFSLPHVITGNCGEVPLLPFECCCLGSIDIAKLVTNQRFDLDKFKELVTLGTRFLDNIIDLQISPIPEIDKIMQANRKIGLGLMGLANALIKMGIPYGSDESYTFAEMIAKNMKLFAHEASVKLAKERGPLPNHKYYKEVTPGFADSPLEGIPRNACVLSFAPTGTISSIADTSGGVEPNFDNVYVKNILDGKRVLFLNDTVEQVLKDNGYESAIEKLRNGAKLKDLKVKKEIKALLVTANEIPAEDHIRMQAALQKYVDHSISKTINFSFEATVEEISNAYKLAHSLGCKGLTVYRDGSRDMQVMETVNRKKKNNPCPRPSVVGGTTAKITSDLGKLYVTINNHNGDPIEIFLSMSDISNDISSILNALARVTSVAMKYNTPIEELCKSLRKIKGGTGLTFDGKRYGSIPILLAHLLSENSVSRVSATTVLSCDKCGSPLIIQEGCQKCSNLDCSYTKCG